MATSGRSCSPTCKWHTVSVCILQTVGTISIPHNLNLDGVMLGGETSAPAIRAGVPVPELQVC